MCEFNDLPLEVMIIIFQKVDSISQKRIQIVCKKWYSVLKAAPFSKEVLLNVAISRDEALVDYKISASLSADPQGKIPANLYWFENVDEISRKINLIKDKLITDKINKIVFILDSKQASVSYGLYAAACFPLALNHSNNYTDADYVPKQNVKSLVLINVPITFAFWTSSLRRRTPNLYFGTEGHNVKLIECRVDVHYLVHPKSIFPPSFPAHEPTNIEVFNIPQVEFELTKRSLSTEHVIQMMEEALPPLTPEQKDDIREFRDAIPRHVNGFLPWATHEHNAIQKYLEESGQGRRDLDKLPKFIQQLLHRITGKNADYTIPSAVRISAPDFWTDVNILALAREKLFGHRKNVNMIIRSHSYQVDYA